MAECNGLIIPIGIWVMETACKHNLQLQREGLPPIRVAVNLSARQIGEKDFIKTVKNVLGVFGGVFVKSVKDVIDATGLDPCYLELEVTESMVMHNIQEVVVILNSLNEMGIQLSLDDFGTGFSSLAYLKRFPIDRLKIDQSFIFNCDSDPGDAIISQTIIALAHGLKIKVIAEGIEKPEHFTFLKENGCDEGQGYFISRPLAYKDLRELLIARQKPH